MFNEVVNMYQRPAQGSQFLKRFPVYSYRHTIAAVGGFDTASFEMALRPGEAQRFVTDYLGCRVHVYKDNPRGPIWEGFINRVTINAGGIVYTRSLDEMQNKVSVFYNNNTNSPSQNTEVDNLTSQAIYGVKEGVIDSGLAFPGKVAILRNTVVGQYGWPQSSVLFNSGAGEFTAQVECMGYYHWLEWEVPTLDTGTTSRTISKYGTQGQIQQLFETIGPENQSMVYCDNASDVTQNPDYVQENDQGTENNVNSTGGGATYWDLMKEFAEVGDGTNPWVAGVTETLTDGTRRLYYRPANLTRKYLVKATSGIITNLFGKPVKPWDVRPDCMGFLSDVNVGIDTDDADPRQFYVQQVDYDADANRVQLRSADDITPEGAFRVRWRGKRHGVRFGATTRKQR